LTDPSDFQEKPDLTLDEFEQINESEAEAEPVVYSGTDFDVEGLVRRFEREDIVVPSFGHTDESLEVAGFQRDFVWRKPQMDRFIESLLLGYPIPGIILVQQQDKRYLVLDGQQRLRTLASFYEGTHGDLRFTLQNVADRFRGLSYKTLTPELKRQLDNTFIQATIVKTDGSTRSLESVYQVFERLNSGGTQLTPHEIRVALYPGEFVRFLSFLNEKDEWRDLYGPKSPRLRDQELILRIIALYHDNEYYRPLKKYLNDFLGQNRNLEHIDTSTIESLFKRAANLLYETQGRLAIRFQSKQVNTALAEALFVGIMRALHSGVHLIPAKIEVTIARLLDDASFTSSISGSTATEEYVRNRVNLATAAFSNG
jgi:hypothetical protein